MLCEGYPQREQSHVVQAGNPGTEASKRASGIPRGLGRLPPTPGGMCEDRCFVEDGLWLTRVG